MSLEPTRVDRLAGQGDSKSIDPAWIMSNHYTKFHKDLINSFLSNARHLQEAQLMLTNPRDAIIGHSRSPNIVQFHMLGVVSY